MRFSFNDLVRFVKAGNFSPLLSCWPILLFLITISVHAGGISVLKLSTDYQDDFAIIQHTPRLSWTMLSSENGTCQSAYQIEIRQSISKKIVWNSGKLNSPQSYLVDISRSNLKADGGKNTYQWRVKVWDEKGNPSAWSGYTSFRFALRSFVGAQWIGAIAKAQSHVPEGRNFHGTDLKKPEVKALWDAVDTLSRRSICLRKDFGANKEVAEAVVTVCGLGNYELSINGKKVGDGEFTPLWSDFDKTIYCNTYDVTDFLRKGRNAIGVLLGNGFYNEQGGRYTKLKISFGPPTLLFQLQITYKDGSCEWVRSDKNWKYSPSPITFNSIYGGEDYDARLEQKGWNLPGFDDKAWKPVILQESPKGSLRPQQAFPVKIMERYGVKTATKLSPEQIKTATVSTKREVGPSALVFDMGQNLAGFPEISLTGKRGRKVTLLVGESLTDEGAANQRQTGRPYFYEYTLKGDGIETWHPRFSYYGFRYIQVEGVVCERDSNPDNLPVLKKLESCFIYNAAPKVSTFETSNDLFNATHLLIEKAVRSNMQAVLTDCPHREKLGWLEQDHLNGPGLLFNYDLRSYGRKLMQDIADAQHPNGAIPSIAPQYVVFEGPGMDAFEESPEWGSTFLIFPFMYRDAYGDDSLIRTFYPQMKAYLDYLTSRADKHILSFGLGDWYDYGNFKAGFSRNTPVPLVATAYYFMDLKYMAEASLLVGNRLDALAYEKLAKDVNKAFNDKFLDKSTSQYGTGSQCSNALPLFARMTTDDKGNMDSLLYHKVLGNLIKDIEAHGNRLTTGDVGNRYLFQVLAETGQNELMYKMFNHEDAPGYGFQLKFGATTLTEQWDPRQGSSWNHFMMGQIDEWFFKSLAGIRINKNEVEIAPKPVGNLTFVKASTETCFGRVAVYWKRTGDIFSLDVKIPVNAKATICLPDGKKVTDVGSGSYHFKTILEKQSLTRRIRFRKRD